MDGEAILGYLFGNESIGVTGAYEGLNGLFQKNSEGYYYYNSEDNHAQLNTQQWRLDLYNARLSPNVNEGAAGFNVGNFLPFNQLPGNAQNGGISSVAGGRAMTDLWFGMNINATFYQPKDGKVNGQEMTFSFTGDDDVWVFIDGVKVLDLGGIHYLQSGTINFSTGDVSITGNIKEENGITTIAEAFEAAYEEKNPGASRQEISTYLEGIFNKDSSGKYTSFKNFSSHEMKFFYLERGAGASNCEIGFNMPVMPKDSITIGKEISNYEQGAYSDVEFEFELYQGSEGENKEKFTQVKNVDYTVRKADGNTETRHIANSGKYEGKIILKHGEQALFSNQFDQGTKYYVKETGLSSDTYDEVIIESSGVVNEDGETIVDSARTEIESTILTVGENYFVNFQNRCAATNMKYLFIEKKMQEGSTSDDDFKVKVTLAGEVYTGSYKIGSNYENALGQTTEYTTDNGEITLKAGQVVVILGYAYTVEGQGDVKKKGIPSGTSFEVEEIDLSDAYQNPSYEVVNATEIGTNGAATGEIILDDNATVTVTNALKFTAIDLIKYGTDYTAGNEKSGAEFSLYKGNMMSNSIEWDNNPLESQIEVCVDGNPELNLPSGYYKLVETKSPIGYQLLGEEIYFQVFDNGTVKLINGTNGEPVSQVSEMWKVTTENETITIKIKNDILYTLPSAGGPGIYWYTLSGTFLMAGAALIVYRQKRKREVLLRK